MHNYYQQTMMVPNEPLTNDNLKQAGDEDTSLPYSRKTIVKLSRALLLDMAIYGNDYLPKDNYTWYRKAGIHKSTFLESVNSYRNFLAFSHELLSQDLKSCFMKLTGIDSDMALKIFLQLFVYDESNSKKADLHNERRALLIIAVFKYSPLLWQDILEFLLPYLSREYAFITDSVLVEILYLYTDAIRYLLITWLKEDAASSSLSFVYSAILDLKRNFLNNRNLYFILRERLKSC